MIRAKTPSNAKAIAKGLVEDLEAMTESGLAAGNRGCPELAMMQSRYILHL